MTVVAATEERYIRSVLNGDDILPEQLYLGILDDEYLSVQNEFANAASTQSQYLQALIQNGALVATPVSRINNRHSVTLDSVRSEYVGLALNCGRRFVHKCNLSEDDQRKIDEVGILAIECSEMKKGRVFIDYKNNVIMTWDLVVGGSVKLSDCAVEYIRNAERIVIVDPYITAGALDVIEELFCTYRKIYGPYEGEVRIYYGEKLRGVVEADVHSRLGQHLSRPNIFLSSSEKRAEDKTRLHERFMQIDNSYTFQFTAGID